MAGQEQKVTRDTLLTRDPSMTSRVPLPRDALLTRDPSVTSRVPLTHDAAALGEQTPLKEMVDNRHHLKYYSGCFSFEEHLQKKVKVQVCVQFFKVGEIDTLKEQYTADVIVRARWREPSLDGKLDASGDINDIKKYWNPKLYIENSYGDPKESFRHRVVFNEKGEAFLSEKRTVKGTFMENLELDDFPFDVQDLTITVASEFPAMEVEIIEDYENRHMVNKQSFVDEQEWHLYAHTECLKRELMIDQFDPNARRSAVSVKCRAARRAGYFVWNIFMVTFLICSLSFATFSVEKTKPQNRLQLSFTLVLTAVAFKSVVNQSLPRISYLTYMDKYLLASMIMLSAICTWHAIVTLLFDDVMEKTSTEKLQKAHFVENIVLICLSVVYILYNVGFCIMIYIFPCKKRRIMSQKDKEHNKCKDLDQLASSRCLADKKKHSTY